MDSALVLSAFGALVVAIVLIDFLATTISIRRDGPLSHALSRLMAAALSIFPEGGRIAQYQGPVILSALAMTWIAGLWAGWSLVFAGGADQLVGPGQTVVEIGDLIGFTGSTISTMGLGIVTPEIAFWHIVAVLSSITGMVVLTLGMTFVLNITQIANESRAFRRQLDRLRKASEELSDQDTVALLMAMDDTLDAKAATLRQQRSCFPLATLYDREGTHDDVERAAQDFVDDMPHASAGTTPSERARIAILRETIDALSERARAV